MNTYRITYKRDLNRWNLRRITADSVILNQYDKIIINTVSYTDQFINGMEPYFYIECVGYLTETKSKD